MSLILRYRQIKGITQKELADDLQSIVPGIDRILISKMETGLCEPSPLMREYLLKACAHADIERKSLNRQIGRLDKKDAEIGDFDPVEEIVLGALKVSSKHNPLTRAKLKDLTGMKDSRARDVIGRLRDKGYRVVGSAGTKGYWIAENESEYLAFRREYHDKAITYLSRISAMDNYTEGQTSMYEDVY